MAAKTLDAITGHMNATLSKTVLALSVTREPVLLMGLFLWTRCGLVSNFFHSGANIDGGQSAANLIHGHGLEPW